MLAPRPSADKGLASPGVGGVRWRNGGVQFEVPVGRAAKGRVGFLAASTPPRRFCQISGLEPYRGVLEGEKPTRSESEGGRREAKITVPGSLEPRVLTEPCGAPKPHPL